MEVPVAIGDLCQALRGNNSIKLQAHLGVFQGRRFTPGTTFEYFNRLFNTFERSAQQDIFKYVPRHEFACFHFADGVCVTFQAGDTKNEVKRKLASVVVSCHNRQFDYQIEAEIVKKVDFDPSVHEPDYVTLHERWSFIYKCWRYDFTKLGTGKNKEIICKTPICFTISISYINDSSALTQVTDQQLAQNLHGKVHDILGRYDKAYNRLPFTESVSSNEQTR